MKRSVSFKVENCWWQESSWTLFPSSAAGRDSECGNPNIRKGTRQLRTVSPRVEERERERERKSWKFLFQRASTQWTQWKQTNSVFITQSTIPNCSIWLEPEEREEVEIGKSEFRERVVWWCNNSAESCNKSKIFSSPIPRGRVNLKNLIFRRQSDNQLLSLHVVSFWKYLINKSKLFEKENWISFAQSSLSFPCRIWKTISLCLKNSLLSTTKRDKRGTDEGRIWKGKFPVHGGLTFPRM